MSEKKLYRWCFVPLCKNSAKNSPDKVFVSVPENENRRKLWFDLARRPDKPTKSNYYCCQDHFNLEEDLLNYTRFKIYGGYLKLKEDAVPRFFECQPDRRATSILKPRSVTEKLTHKRKIADILNDSNKENITANIINVAKVPSKQTKHVFESSNINIQSISSDLKLTNIISSNYNKPTENNIANMSTYEDIFDKSYNNMYNENECVSGNTVQKIPLDASKRNVKYQTKAIQARVHYRSKQVSCNIKINKPVIDASCSPIRMTEVKDATTSPIRFKCVKSQQISSESSTTTTSFQHQINQSEYEPSSDEKRNSDEERNVKMKVMNMTNYLINKNPKVYLGISQEWLWIINLLSVESEISSDYIKLILMKIRLDDTFERLSEQFGMSTNHACRIFNSFVPKLAFYLQKLIFFPSKKSIRKTMPIPFRANYNNVQSIIDCFEISIQKPSNSVDQALTWSDYKGHNTIKYCISSTPDGLINFISKGYSGRVSDILLFENCGILDKLPAGCSVMADRGFKGIQTLLLTKNCDLIRPPSVSSNEKLSKEEALETKRIASLRIHIERVIRRLREFSMLQPCASLSTKFVKHIDSMVIIAAALCNLKNPIIKT